ncbi:hypothetical protein CNE_BB1p02860 (plasmid) [Cupriavidus necator N-1]|uniref:Integrase n=1 Tax=Cupriavidus necator (strain ATCC 43291 / DSM 13513 / CCUG 52238 / LMG 8453 / N-1) TaxID=1042878 RepID=F8GWD5_CUPNN|nr:hypothetical protein CNE_BB1p02860 [Cupriavidus necator N-1]
MTDRQVDLRYVRDNFGHSSISTSGYLRSEEDARHEARAASEPLGQQDVRCDPRLIHGLQLMNAASLHSDNRPRSTG